ncbi:hypothetical protein LTR36_005809 [Oleoguttula mirabilis]|uniref:BIR-domain-containing protein n=1 Tax=Oleoguttula mirabilis TaxID=1507867 RepID=A0AAV9JDM2_9PEZI|nr:hypothetical protein LTR36_005809 [Oleoguttula mirabilis]
MAGSPDMQTFASRLATFQHPHQLSKRRASSQGSKRKNGGGNTVEWPHERPAAEELARAGFFYHPVQDSTDNVQCFLCTVKLDGWESEDDPLREHLAHSTACAWAMSISVTRLDDGEHEEESRDPLSAELIAARRGTFESGEGWIHEGKRGWKCKVSKMVDAGWTFDPSPETEPDGVTCFYCNLSLDGWEPKDDPFEEHRRRSPECAFFALVEHYHGGVKTGKAAAGKKGRGRPSNASKASRLSTQSALSTFSADAASVMMHSDVEEDGATATVDDSIMSTATTASQATVKGKKKGGRKPAAAPKGAKGRKRADTVDDDEAIEVHYPELSQSQQSQHMPSEFAAESSVVIPVEESAPPPKPTRKGTRQSKQAVDSSVMEASQLETAPKAKRGRKPKVQPQPEPSPEPELELEPELEPEVEEHRLSEVSAQLQEELEDSMDHMDEPDNASTPQPAPAPAKAKRGVKRTSEGFRKEEQDSSVVLGVEFPVPPKAAPAPVKGKGKKGRKPSKQPIASSYEIVVEEREEPVVAVDQEEIAVGLPEYGRMDDEVAPSQPEPEKPKRGGPKAKKAPAKKGKGKKTSSARSSKATGPAEVDPYDDEAAGFAEREEDLERDEREIEAELARIAAEQRQERQQDADALALATTEELEPERADEYEPSPSHSHSHHQPNHHNHHHADQHAQQIHRLELELQAESDAIPDPSVGMANLMATVGAARLPASSAVVFSPSPEPERAGWERERSVPGVGEVEEEERIGARGAPLMSSPSGSGSGRGSDKENEPSSALQPATTARKTLTAPPPPTILLSPTKTTRIPLAPGTPNRAPCSPSKQQAFLSPSKQQTFSRLTSSTPWTAVDLDTILLASPQPTPGTLGQRLAAAAGTAGLLTSPEKGMSVEQWVRYRAAQGEAALRRRCEALVSAFEREGGRAVEGLGGVGVAS